MLCRSCHDRVHERFTVEELAADYDSAEKLYRICMKEFQDITNTSQDEGGTAGN